MTENKSLELSLDIKKAFSKNLLPVFEKYFPYDVAESYSVNTRDRLYTPGNTLQTMLLTSCYEDKSLKESVFIYKTIHEKYQELLSKKAFEFAENQKKEQSNKPGRPRKSFARIPVSKTKEISSDTSGYSQARQRLNINLVNEVYEESRSYTLENDSNKWLNREVFAADGTYLQLQDTEDIREEFSSEKKGGYPRGLLQAVTSFSYGTVYSHRLSTDSKSELEVFSEMIADLPSWSILLADDLYNCHAIFALLKSRNIDIVVPGKRHRKYELVEKIAEGDEIVRIKNSKLSPWLKGKDIETVKNTRTLEMRRIEYIDPNKGISGVLYTSLMDKSISKTEIILKYLSRYDIEISIREVKTIMHINVVRSKTAAMSKKEVTASLTAYNYIRRLITESTLLSAFSPERDIIYEYNTLYKDIHIDKLGRVYQRWSPGRYGKVKQGDTEIKNTISTRQGLPEENQSRKIQKI